MKVEFGEKEEERKKEERKIFIFNTAQWTKGMDRSKGEEGEKREKMPSTCLSPTSSHHGS